MLKAKTHNRYICIGYFSSSRFNLNQKIHQIKKTHKTRRVVWILLWRMFLNNGYVCKVLQWYRCTWLQKPFLMNISWVKSSPKNYLVRFLRGYTTQACKHIRLIFGIFFFFFFFEKFICNILVMLRNFVSPQDWGGKHTTNMAAIDLRIPIYIKDIFITERLIFVCGFALLNNVLICFSFYKNLCYRYSKLLDRECCKRVILRND